MTSMGIILVVAGSVFTYALGWYYAAKIYKVDSDTEAVFVLAFFGLLPALVGMWYGRYRPSKADRMERLTIELEKQAKLIERMERASKLIPAEKWQVIRAEHLESVVEKLTKAKQ